MHRCITDREGKVVPILDLYSVVGTGVSVIRQVGDPKLDGSIRHAMAIVVKITVVRHFQRIIPELAVLKVG